MKRSRAPLSDVEPDPLVERILTRLQEHRRDARNPEISLEIDAKLAAQEARAYFAHTSKKSPA